MKYNYLILTNSLWFIYIVATNLENEIKLLFTIDSQTKSITIKFNERNVVSKLKTSKPCFEKRGYKYMKYTEFLD